MCRKALSSEHGPFLLKDRGTILYLEIGQKWLKNLKRGIIFGTFLKKSYAPIAQSRKKLETLGLEK